MMIFNNNRLTILLIKNLHRNLRKSVLINIDTNTLTKWSSKTNALIIIIKIQDKININSFSLRGNLSTWRSVRTKRAHKTINKWWCHQVLKLLSIGEVTKRILRLNAFIVSLKE